jgi:hypothetical protein
VSDRDHPAEEAAAFAEHEMQSFIAFLRERGFKSCPICGETSNFTWAHAATFPGGGVVRMTAHLPGHTTVPGKPDGHREPFNTPLMLLLCDNCTHLMTFSATQYWLEQLKARSDSQADPT